MNGEYSWWLLVVGLAIGIIGTWLVRGTLARTDADLAARERVEEAAWISRTIEDAGGVAPADLIEQVLELHRSYLSGPPFLVPGSIEDEAAPQALQQEATALPRDGWQADAAWGDAQAPRGRGPAGGPPELLAQVRRTGNPGGPDGQAPGETPPAGTPVSGSDL